MVEKKGHADASHEIEAGEIPWKTVTTKKDLKKCLEWVEARFITYLAKLNQW